MLREGRWITRERVTYCGFLFSLVSVLFLTAGAISHTKNRYVGDNGEQLAIDFINYYAGAKVAVTGEASRVYDRAWLVGVEEAITGPAAPRMYSYPPTAMLLCLPLALFSFIGALIAWVAAGLMACVAVLRHLIGWRAAAFASLGMPAAFFNVYGGQNGYFTAALLGGGLMVLERRPVVSGICLGLLAYKPHMAMLVPFGLAVTRRWTAFAAAAATAILLVLASVVILGPQTWIAFLGQLAAERHFLDVEAAFSHRMPTVFVALRELGVASSLAYAAQLVSAALAIIAVVVAWRAPAALDSKAAVLIVATFVATPHAWDYDEVVLVFAAALLWRDAQRSGFLPWERLAIAALLILPMPSIMLNVLTAIELGPLVLWPVLLLLVRRTLVTGAGLRARGFDLGRSYAA